MFVPFYQHVDDVVRVLCQELNAVVLQLPSQIAAHLIIIIITITIILR